MRMIRDSHQSLSCFVLELRLSIHEIADSLNLSSSYSSSKLVQLCKSEVFCFIDDDSIGIEEVDTIFYHRRREENIVHAELEFHDAVFEFIGWELTIRDDDFCLGDK